MAKLTGGGAIVQGLIDNGVETVFGLPGVQLDGLFNALFDRQNEVKVVHSRHEQGAAYMAYGYAQSTGRVGTYAVVPGPGILNSGAALSTAYACNTPVLCLTGQIPSPALGRQLGLLHEIPHQLEVLSGLTKWAARINHATQAPAMVRDAFYQLNSGRRRPVALEAAMDVMHASSEVTPIPGMAPPPPQSPDPDQIEEAAKLLGQAQSPLIIVGGGVFGGEEALQTLAETLQAPVVSWKSGRGALTDKHYLSVTQPLGHELWASADVVLAIGTRFQQHRMGWGLSGLKVININIDPHDMNALGRPDVGIVADAPASLGPLNDALQAHNRKRDSRAEEMTDLKAKYMQRFQSELAPQMAFLSVMRDVLPDDGIFVEDLTQLGYVCRFGFPIYKPRTLINTGYQGTLGHSYATALGVKVGNPDKQVLSVSGDGGFMFNIQEMSTAARYGIGVVHVVMNDNAFGNVRRMQVDLYDNRVIATDLKNPDFAKTAELFGMTGMRAETPEALKSALETAFADGGPTVIEVPVGEMPDPWGFINLGKAR